MDKSVCVRDVDLEYNCSLGTSRSKSSTATIFPPTLQSQPTSPETRDSEEPPLCKRVVHVHLRASEKQHKLDAAWLDTKNTAQRTSSPSILPVCLTSDREQPRDMGYVNEYLTSGLPTLPSLNCAACFVKRQLTNYAQQWRHGLSMDCKWSMVDACCSVTCVNWVWCLVLGTWLEQNTARRWGIVETVLATAMSGGVFQLLGGQATLIVGPSSLSLIFIVAILTSAKRLGVDALSWMGWIGVWGSLVLFLLALSNACKVVSHVTFFSWGVICIFIRLILLWGAVEQIVHLFKDSSHAPDSALLSLWLTTTTFFVALLLGKVRKWQAFHHRLWEGIAEYGPLLVLLLFTAIPLLPKLNQTHISQVSLPKSGYHTDEITRLGCISLKLLPFWAILLAVIPGIMLAGVLFIYHNAVVSLIQDESMPSPLYKNSKKWDICIVGFLVFLCSLFGLPYTCGMLYQSDVHVRALTLKPQEFSDMEDQRGLVKQVRAQRISSLMASLLSAAFLFPPLKRLVERIPLAVLTGLLMELTCRQHGSWNISTFILKSFNKRNEKGHRPVSKSALCVIFIAQISCVSIITIVSKTPAAVMFPLFILVTLWIRHSAMRHLFRREDFAKLDTELSKDYSDLSSSGPLSAPSYDIHAHTQQAWPRITIPQTLKSVVNAPGTDVHISQQHPLHGRTADITAENVESPLQSAMSPSLLFASSRRLKERSRRRYKRKRQVSLDAAEAESFGQPHEPNAPIPLIPPLVKAMMQEQNQPSLHEQEEEVNLTKRVSPRLSPQFFKKSKPKAGQERPLEVHSNLLYEPKMVARNPPLGSKKQGEEPSSRNVLIFHETEIQSSIQRQEIVGFQGSPGIGRCIRSPPAFKNKTPISIIGKKKQLQLSISIPRRRAFPKEEVYPGAREQARKLNANPYPRLRRSNTSRWPTTAHGGLHHQHERHSTSQSKEEIEHGA